MVPDEGNDDEQEYVLLPDEIYESLHAPGSWTEVEGQPDLGTGGGGTAPVPCASSLGRSSAAALPIHLGARLGDLSVSSPEGHIPPSPPPPQPVSRVRSFEHLDHGNPDEAMAYRHLLPPERYLRLRTGLNKIEAYRERFDRPRDHYRENLALIALSGWADATRYCLCAIKNSSSYS